MRSAPRRVLKDKGKREFPDHPVVGVGAVVIDRGRVLLIRRGREPLKGHWSIPGGVLELGEELTQGLRRELREETGLEVTPLEVIAIFDRIFREGAKVRYHYVIVDYVCRKRAGRVQSGSDVTEARWVHRADLARYELSKRATSVILRAFSYFEHQRRRRG